MTDPTNSDGVNPNSKTPNYGGANDGGISGADYKKWEQEIDKELNGTNPWLMGMGAYMNPEQAKEFVAKFKQMVCKSIATQISADQKRLHKAAEKLKRILEHKRPQ